MLIVPTTGAIYWLPARTQLGTHAVTVRARNQAGLFVTQTFSITTAAAVNGRYYDLRVDLSSQPMHGQSSS